MYGSGSICNFDYFSFTAGKRSCAVLRSIPIGPTREVSPTDMANDVKEIEYLARQLEGIMQSVSPQNWDDVADSWFNLAKLSHGEWIGSRDSTCAGVKSRVRKADSAYRH